ncbi:MAG: extracellular solute-binding protein [Fimbriimonadaceae bacterium]|nr:extracellular solute-binding protein [Fimbriimonadaceae bacterium]
MTRREILIALAAVCVLGPTGCRRVLESRRIVRYANWGSPGDDGDAMRLVRRLLDGFSRKHPEYGLEVESIPGSQEYLRKVLLSYIAGSEPDVLTLDASSAAIFIENNVLKDLVPYVSGRDGIRLDEFFPNVVDIARRGGALYAIPIDFNPLMLYYNKRLFEKAGVPEPIEGWQFGDFLNAAKGLTQGEQYGFEFGNWMPGWIPWIWNEGGDVLSPEGKSAKGFFDGDGSVRAITFLRDLIKTHRVAPSLSQSAALGIDFFSHGRSAMKVSGHWELVGLASAKDVSLDEIGVVPLPTMIASSQTVAYEAGLSIGKHCRDPEAAWAFIRYYTSEAFQLEYQTTGIAICARKSVAEARADTAVKQKFVNVAGTARQPWGATVVAYDQVERIGQDAMDRILTHDIEPEIALREAADRIDNALAEAAR